MAGGAAPPKISRTSREEIIHAFTEDLVYIRTKFPMGKTGLKIKDGVVTPNGVELDHLMALWGPAAKPGDRARISDILIKDDHIRFEINGGPVKKQKWYQHIQVSGTGSTTPIAPSDASANARGSFVDLYFDKYVPELTGPELKDLLRPVFDFNSKLGARSLPRNGFSEGTGCHQEPSRAGGHERRNGDLRQGEASKKSARAQR